MHVFPADHSHRCRGGGGEALLRRRKPWYYEHEPRPDISVLGARLSELLRQEIMTGHGPLLR